MSMAKKKAKARIAVGDPGHDRDMKKPIYRAAYENRRLIQQVALKVRSMREGRGLTQEQLAKLIGSSQPTIARLERGLDQRVPRWDLLRRIGLALGKQLKWVFADPPEDSDGEELVEVQTAHGRAEQRDVTA
jgi:DNA-binding XRE family transcriptional regulator